MKEFKKLCGEDLKQTEVKMWEETWKIYIPEDIVNEFKELNAREGKKRRKKIKSIFDSMGKVESEKIANKKKYPYIDTSNAHMLEPAYDESGNQTLGEELVHQLRIERNSIVPDDLMLIKQFIEFNNIVEKKCNAGKSPGKVRKASNVIKACSLTLLIVISCLLYQSLGIIQINIFSKNPPMNNTQPLALTAIYDTDDLSIVLSWGYVLTPKELVSINTIPKKFIAMGVANETTLALFFDTLNFDADFQKNYEHFITTKHVFCLVENLDNEDFIIIYEKKENYHECFHVIRSMEDYRFIELLNLFEVTHNVKFTREEEERIFAEGTNSLMGLMIISDSKARVWMYARDFGPLLTSDITPGGRAVSS